MKLEISKKARKVVDQSILITGSARSGTSIVNTLVHSLNGIESEFEPPMLFSLIPMIGKMDNVQWTMLFETYLYEDVFIPALSGRRINLNRYDDSSIWKAKDETAIADRLSQSWSKKDAVEKSTKHRLAFKMPDIVPFLKSIKTHYPGMKLITTRRDYRTTLSSLMKKGWFSTEVLDTGSVWPFSCHENQCIPYWVDEQDHSYWTGMTELERCAYYFIKMNEGLMLMPERHDVWYEDLIEKPENVISRISCYLNASTTPITTKVLETISPRANNDDLDCSGLAKSIIEKMEYFSTKDREVQE